MTSQPTSRNDLLDIAQLMKKGDRQEAKLLLGALLKQDPQNADAWYLAAYLVSDMPRRKQLLERCLSIEPRHAEAKQALAKLQASISGTNVIRPISPVRKAPHGNSNVRRLSVLCLLVLAVAIGVLATFFRLRVSVDVNQTTAQAQALPPSQIPPSQVSTTAPTSISETNTSVAPTMPNGATGSTNTGTANAPQTLPAQQASTKWQYLTLSLSQNSVDFSRPLGDRYVAGEVSDPALNAEFFGEINKCFDPNTQSNMTTFGGECAQKYSHPLMYYFDKLGDENWELVSVVDKSNQTSFTIEAYFKRPAR